ncbi:helix-turn-helix transcriptional regulator [Kineosporia sp. J2-2]|uniref:Helix-turn-helix transcriptional regulator n=1 Tax=Kineosporia corallincola TaxID=2835133 RepID=A0ABS5TNT2_9ACTN|nr:helix-turn-helix transcriptional regulator [Kineosporia corallincola]MBT0772758.1 helix-turn-helix transcriptional regulator [Kineosporia corallincola]
MLPDDDAPLDPKAVLAAALRSERERGGLSLSELAKQAGLAKSTLSQLESGSGNPNVETLWALAAALDLPVSRLVDPPRPKIEVVRNGEGTPLLSEQGDYAAFLMSAGPAGVVRDLYRLNVGIGPGRISEPHAVGVVEHVIIGTGRALVGPTSNPVELGPGDYMGYPGDVEHMFQALTPGVLATLISESR